MLHGSLLEKSSNTFGKFQFVLLLKSAYFQINEIDHAVCERGWETEKRQRELKYNGGRTDTV